jgi:hypothetical protein
VNHAPVDTQDAAALLSIRWGVWDAAWEAYVTAPPDLEPSAYAGLLVVERAARLDYIRVHRRFCGDAPPFTDGEPDFTNARFLAYPATVDD